MAAVAASIGAFMASILLIEGIQAYISHRVGNPEEDVQLTLQRLQSQNERRALNLIAGEQAGEEEIERRFAAFNAIPKRALASAALNRMPGPGPLDRDTSLLDFVSQRMGVAAEDLDAASHPRRMTDMSSIFHAMGKTPPGR